MVRGQPPVAGRAASLLADDLFHLGERMASEELKRPITTADAALHFGACEKLPRPAFQN
jgi:hypothetical protein